MADTALFMTAAMIANEEDACMRRVSSLATSRQLPGKITLLLPSGGTRGGAHTTIYVDTPHTYEAAIDRAYEAFPYDLKNCKREDISFALARPRRGGGVMLHAPFHRTDDAWAEGISHIASDQCVQVVTPSSSPPRSSSARHAHHSSDRTASEKVAPNHSGSCVRKIMKSLVKFD